MTSRQAVNATDARRHAHQGERTYYVYNAAGERVRKTTISGTGVKLHERFYLGGCEVYRRYAAAGNVTLERQTLHVMDDKRRVALVETITIDTMAAPTSPAYDRDPLSIRQPPRHSVPGTGRNRRGHHLRGVLPLRRAPPTRREHHHRGKPEALPLHRQGDATRRRASTTRRPLLRALDRPLGQL